MYLATDYIHPYRGVIGVRSRCRIRLYLPQDDQDAAVIICSELPDNPGTSVVDAAEQIAAEIIQHFRLPSPRCGSSTARRRSLRADKRRRLTS